MGLDHQLTPGAEGGLSAARLLPAVAVLRRPALLPRQDGRAPRAHPERGSVVGRRYDDDDAARASHSVPQSRGARRPVQRFLAVVPGGYPSLGPHSRFRPWNSRPGHTTRHPRPGAPRPDLTVGAPTPEPPP